MQGEELRVPRLWDDGGPRFVAQDPQSSPDRGFLLFAVSCQEPQCACQNLYLDVVPAARGEDRVVRATGERLSLVYDVARDLLQPRRELLVELNAAEALKARLSAEERRWFLARFARGRGQLDEAPWRGSDVAAWASGALTPFSDVYPHDWDLMLRLDGRTFGLVDQYCMNPDCTCEDVAIDIIDAERSRNLGYVQTPLGAAAGARGDNEVSDGVWKTFIAHEGMKRLEERHQRARTAAHSVAKAAARATPAARGAKVGRNEPCPCGSGKKYKRCCGA